MTYWKKIQTSYDDTGNIDAFGRLRVSEVTTQIDLKQIHSNLPLFIDEVDSVSGASHSHSTSTAETTLSVSGSAGNYAISQTRQRFNYQTGKSQMIFMTFSTFDVESGIDKRIGYYTTDTTGSYSTNLDGLFLYSSSADNAVSINIYRSGTLVEKTTQANWNLDKLNGTGSSGITIDWDKTQILIIDFEWLGVGRVRWGVIVDGAIVYFHESNHANNLTAVYMSSPNKPLRWEARTVDVNTGGTFKFICATVGSEGAINKLGSIRSYNTGSTSLSATTSGTRYATLGIRLNSSRVDTLIDLLTFDLLGTTNDNFMWELWLNTGVDGTFTYNSVTNSSIQVAVGATANTLTLADGVPTGLLIDSGFVQQNTNVRRTVENAVRLGMAINGTLDTIVLSVMPLSPNLSIYSSITWQELI